MALPPRWLRRLLLAPVAFVGAVALAIASPLIHIVLALLDLGFDRRRWRFTRFGGLGLAFCVVEAFGLFAMLTTWVGSGFGRLSHRRFWVRAHTLLLGQWLELITRAIRFYLGFSFTCTLEPSRSGRQLILGRHAGPGDALLISRIIVRDRGQRVKILGTSKLQWDPFFDILGERLGFHYTALRSPDAQAERAAVTAVAASLEPDEALVIFPEGGNFTPARREAQLEHLADHDAEALEAARGLRHTLLPRIGGVNAALDGCPDAVVLFVAHAGLEGIFGLGDLWRTVPLRRDIRAHLWPASTDPPSAFEDRKRWLHGEWSAVDDWIDDALGDIDRADPEGHDRSELG